MKKIGIITTSRADFGLYIPLLNEIEQHPGFDFMIFAGGMHTSPYFGLSYKIIENQYNFSITEKVVSLTNNDTPTGIAQSMGLTTLQFGSIWAKYEKDLDLVIVLGDRYEMLAASLSLVPFNIPIVHLFGGETTMGAIDDKFRTGLTAIAKYHFTSHDKHAERVMQITGRTEHVYNVGALGTDSCIKTPLMSTDAFYEKFGFDITRPYFLTTYHPETVDLRNDVFIQELIAAIREMKTPVLCTLPNADTQGSLIRAELLEFEKEQPKLIKCFENLGQKGYLTAMSHAFMLLGNTSSGIVEAGAFNKIVLNVGNRQKGRYTGKNVIHVENNRQSIIDGFKKAQQVNLLDFINPYGKGNSAQQIITILEKEFIT